MKIKVLISRFLKESGSKPYFVTCRTHNIRRAHESFSKLSDLKEFYQISKVTKTGRTEWALSPRGKRHEWNIYEAEISSDYLV